MAWTKKSTGLAADLQSLIMVQEGGTTFADIVDIGNVDSVPVADSQVTIDAVAGETPMAFTPQPNGAWAGYGVELTTPPTVNHGFNGAGVGQGLFAIIQPGPSGGNRGLLWANSGPYGLFRDGGANPAAYGLATGVGPVTGQPARTDTVLWANDYSDLIVIAYNVVYDSTDGFKIFSDDLNTGSRSDWTHVNDSDDLSGNGTMTGIGEFPAGGQGHSADRCLAIGVCDVGRQIALSEVIELRNNWFNYLIESGAPTTTTATFTIAGGASLSGLQVAVFNGNDISVVPVVDQSAGNTSDGAALVTVDLAGLGFNNGDPVTAMITDFTTTPTAGSKGAVCYSTVVVA